MKQNTLIVIIICLVLVCGAFYFWKADTATSPVAVYSPLNAVYTIEGEKVELIQGKSESQLAPGSASKVVTQYFGNDVKYDFNSDGKLDLAFIMTQERGGSGTFYYLVAALNTGSGYVGSEGYFLGDRISPQTTEMSPGGIVVVNFADRLVGQSFTDKTSVGKSMWFKFDPTDAKFIEVPQPQSEGISPAHQTLDMQKWTWVSTTYSDGGKVQPKNPSAFVLVFKDSKTFSATTDCNGVSGGYSLAGNKISFSNMISTLMYCDGSQETDFQKTLSAIDSYHFGPSGELIFDLKMDSGTAVFK
jgi:heat shock protein HslJ